jgi:hypothetical protein
VYVPVAGRITGLRKREDPPVLFEASVVPSGLRILMATQQPKVEFASCTLAYWPAVPLKVNKSGCPGFAIVTPVGVPGVMALGVSLNTERRTVPLPVFPF